MLELHNLASGRLEIAVTPGEYALSSLCGFAARRNPKRGFLFVSKVLGRYLPVRPSKLSAAWRALTAQLPDDLAGPIVVVGVAEAGLALAQGVHRELHKAGRADAILINTTRYRFDREVAFEFDEAHSHAPAHRVYRPSTLTTRALMDNARTVIVVDDEVTTGRTFRGLVHAYHKCFPLVTRYHHLVLTDWHQGSLTETVEPPAGVQVSLSTLLAGQYSFRPDPRFVPQMPNVVGGGKCKAALVGTGSGRFGIRRPLNANLTNVPNIAAGERVLVLGTGEFQTPPLLVAEALESRGVDAWFQTTTRAPVIEGGAIKSIMSFEDNYEESMPNFLYNVDRSLYDRVLLCLETPEHTAPRALIEALDARPIHF